MTIFFWVVGIILSFFFGIYLLYAIGKSIENFRAYHLEYFMPIYIGAVLLAIAIPQFQQANFVIKARVAKATLSSIKEECSKDPKKGIRSSSSIPVLKNYSIVPNDSDCNGDKNNLIKAVSSDESKFPSYSINLLTGEKTCFYNGSHERFASCNSGSSGWD